MSKKIIEPGSALDWFTVGQYCEAVAKELIRAHPHEPMRGRIEMYREVAQGDRRYVVKVRMTLVPAGNV